MRKRESAPLAIAPLNAAGTASSGAAPRLYERAFHILADRIAKGAIAPGTHLMEARIAAQFGISRAPARQALAHLEAVGLLRKAKAHGYVVAAGAAAAAVTAADDVSAPFAQPMRLTAAASWERIYREVEGEIATRISFGSWRVTETELARQYGVSRTVARDVLARLQQRGLLKKDEKARWLAPALTSDYVNELYEMRWVLEPAALIKAAANVKASRLAQMRRNLERTLSEAEGIDSRTLDDLEQEMHVGLLGHCGSRALMEALHHYQSLLIAHRFLYSATARLYPVEPFLAEHLAIIERLETGDIQDAAALLSEHLKRASERAIARIEAISRELDPQPLPYLQRL